MEQTRMEIINLPPHHPARFITHSIYSFSFCVRCFRSAAAEMLREQEAAYEMLIYDYLIFIRRPRFSLQSAKSPFPSCKKGKLSCCELPLNNSPPPSANNNKSINYQNSNPQNFLESYFHADMCRGGSSGEAKYKEKVSNCSIVETEGNFWGRTDINNLRNSSEKDESFRSSAELLNDIRTRMALKTTQSHSFAALKSQLST